MIEVVVLTDDGSDQIGKFRFAAMPRTGEEIMLPGEGAVLGIPYRVTASSQVGVDAETADKFDQPYAV